MSTDFRSYFTFFHQKENELETAPFVYLDSAATSQKLQSSIQAMEHYHKHYNANVHRGGYMSAKRATDAFEHARESLARFIGAKRSDEVIFTSGTTEAINIIANGICPELLRGNTILICESEHHANLVPWQQLAQRHGMHIEVLRLEPKGIFNDDTLSRWLNQINDNVALVALGHISNVLGNIYPVQTLCKKASQHNVLSVIDGTQAPAHVAIDVVKLECDFYAMSGHKMYASGGIGILYGKYDLLLQLHPSKLGGEMIDKVTWQHSEYALPPVKFEGGTPNIAAALSMPPACDFLCTQRSCIQAHEKTLYSALLDGLGRIPSLMVLGNLKSSIGLVSFTLDNIHANDVATALSHHNIAVRAGHHCAMPLMQGLNISGCVRVSLACYNTLEDVCRFINALSAVVQSYQAETRHLGHDLKIEASSGSASAELAAQDLAQLIDRFSQAHGWNNKHRLLLLSSKTLNVLPLALRKVENEVAGCEAKVWLGLHKTHFQAYSDSKVVRGLLTVILVKANTARENQLTLSRNDYFEFLETLGLPHYFSEGRRDGIGVIIDRLLFLQNT